MNDDRSLPVDPFPPERLGRLWRGQYLDPRLHGVNMEPRTEEESKALFVAQLPITAERFLRFWEERQAAKSAEAQTQN